MPSKLGIHGIMPGGTIEVLQQLVASGATMPTIKSVEGPGWLKDVKQIDPNIKTVGRFIRGEDRSMDIEGPPIMTASDLKQTAHDVMYNLMPRWDEHRAYVDHWEIINEQDPPGTDGHRRLAEFMIHCIDIAEAEGYKLALFSYSLGVPEWDEMQTIVETGVFGRAKAGGHALALHEYAYPMDVWFGEPLPGLPTYPDRGPLACRYRWWYEDFLKPRGEVIPLYLTEVNVARDLPLVPMQEWMRQLAWYDERLREDYYVVGAHLFTLGSGGGWKNYEFNDRLPLLIDHIIALKDTQDPAWPAPESTATPAQPTPTIPQQPTPPPSDDGPIPSQPIVREEPVKPIPVLEPIVLSDLPRVPVERHYLLLPPDADWQWVAACQGYWEKFHISLGTNLDDAGYGPGLKIRAVTVINPDKWPENLKTFFEQNYPGVKYDPILARSPRELKMILQWRIDKNRPLGGAG